MRNIGKVKVFVVISTLLLFILACSTVGDINVEEDSSHLEDTSNRSCYTADGWERTIESATDYDVRFAPDPESWDYEWVVNRSTSGEGMYGLLYDEGATGCITEAAAIIVVDPQYGDAGVVGVMMGAVRGYFDPSANTDVWFSDNMDTCAERDVEDTLHVDGAVWNFYCGYEDGLLGLRLHVSLP